MSTPAPNSPPDVLLAELYTQLRAAAQQHMAHERANHTLTATALVHEAWLRLAGPREIPFERRSHLYTAAVEAMRHVLLDHAKARGRHKRGGKHKTTQPIDFDAPLDLASDDKVDDFLIVDDAIEKLR